MQMINGHNGQVGVDADWLIIERKGLGRVGHSKGDRRILVSTVTAVQMRPAGRLANGFIRFTVPGSPDLRGGLGAANTDENTVIFRRSQQAAFDALRADVERRISDHLAALRRT